MVKYVVYVKDGKYWMADNKIHTLREAKSIVKGLRENGSKAFYNSIETSSNKKLDAYAGKFMKEDWR